MKSVLVHLIIGLVAVHVQQCFTASVNSTDFIIDDEAHDPFKDMCKHHEGEYYRDASLEIVCCANDTLKLPDVLIHDSKVNKAFAECSQKISKEDPSDFPTEMWKVFICKLRKSAVFKTKDKLSFSELLTFLTQFYPAHILKELKVNAKKCEAIDSQNLEDHLKIQKYMECYYKAENKTCHKPYGNFSVIIEDDKKRKELGCPVIPGDIDSSIEFCCKKRSTPYPISEYPEIIWTEEAEKAYHDCTESFAQREVELMPEIFKVSTPKTNEENDQDHSIHTSWDFLCIPACLIQQKNYTKSMLKLDVDPILAFYHEGFGKTIKSEISKIIKRRVQNDKIFLSMDVDTENSKPKTFTELSKSFSKADEKEKIQFYCKFVETVLHEERRALQEYCFDEKHANEWGESHLPFYAHHE